MNYRQSAKVLSKAWNKLFSDIGEVPDVFQNAHFPSLDGLRAVSILVVIIAHVLLSYKLDYDFRVPADLGVQFFFTISGFLITTLLIKERVKTGNISLKKFYIRRFFRIIPVSYLYLVLIIILNYLLHLHLHFYFIVASFLFARNFFMSASGSDHLTTHYWSLSFEEQFYLLFPVILKKSHRVYLWFLLSIILFSVITDFFGAGLYKLLGGNVFAKQFIWFITGLKSISVGSILSILVFKKIIKINFRYKNLTVLALLALLFLVTTFNGAFPNISVIVGSIIFGLIMIENLQQSGSLFFKFLNTRALKLIGVLSYSLYIWQQPFTLNLTYLNSSHFVKAIGNKLFADIAITVLSLLLLGIISYLSYFFFEKRFLQMKQKFK